MPTQTYLQRFTAIANALFNGTTTTTQMLAVGNAYVDQLGPDTIFSMFGVLPVALTNEQISQVYVTAILNEAINSVRYTAQKGAQSATAASIQAAGDAAVKALT